jgi:hypothetical protein
VLRGSENRLACLFIDFGSTRDCTQDLTLARQVLYHRLFFEGPALTGQLLTVPPVCLPSMGGGVSLFCRRRTLAGKGKL